MKFVIREFKNNRYNYFYVSLLRYTSCNSRYYSSGETIIKILKNYIPTITIEEYRAILEQCNIVGDENNMYITDNMANVSKAVNILNEKYIIMINLIGV